MSEYVYLFKNPKTGLTKIGYSCEPHKRKESLEKEFDAELEVIAVAKSEGAFKLEKELHQLEADKRVDGEWFNLLDFTENLRNALADKLIDWSDAVRTTQPEAAVFSNIRSQVKKRMEDLGISQYELEKEHGISQAAVSRFLSGKRYKASDEVLKLFEVLKGKLVLEWEE